MRGSASSPSSSGIERSRRTMSGCRRPAAAIAAAPSDAVPATAKPCCSSSPESASRVSGWSSAIRTRVATTGLSADAPLPTTPCVTFDPRDAYQSWLLGELLLVAVLGAGLAFFATNPSLLGTWPLPNLRLVLDTAVAVAAALVAVLAGLRFAVEGRRLELLLCAGFATAAVGTAAFAIGPVLGEQSVHRAETWAGLTAQLAAAALIAGAAFARGRMTHPALALRATLVGC